MIDVAFTGSTKDAGNLQQWRTGVFFAVTGLDLQDRFDVLYTHEGVAQKDPAHDRVGRTYGDVSVIPVPNYLMTVPGKVTASFGGKTLTFTVVAATEPEGYDAGCCEDIDTHQPMISRIESEGGGSGGSGGPVEWDNVTGKPETFPPSSHTHGGEDIEDGSIATDKLAPNSVTTDKLAGGAVTSAKLGSNVVQWGNLAGSVQDLITNAGGAIADGSIATAKIADGAVTADKLAEDYLPLSGGQLTGPVTVKTASSAVSEESAASGYGNGVGFCGSNGTRNANLQLQNHPNGTLALRIEARRKVNDVLKYNNFKVGVDASGNPKYEVSSPAAFRSAIGAAPNVSSAMTATVASQTPLGTSRVAAPLAESTAYGSGFTISGGKVKCGFTGYVLACAGAFFSYLSGEASPGVENPELAVAVNGEVVAAAGVVVPGQWGAGLSLAPVLLSVSANDLISFMVVNNTVARGVVRAISANYLTVLRIA